MASFIGAITVCIRNKNIYFVQVKSKLYPNNIIPTLTLNLLNTVKLDFKRNLGFYLILTVLYRHQHVIGQWQFAS